MSNNQVVLFLRNVNGESKWFEVSDVKIWIRVFWKMFTNGKYVGEIENKETNVQGTQTWSDGDKYVGEWKDGKKHGQGTFTSPNGRKYVGEFRKGKQFNTTLYNKDGNIYGRYVNGVRQ